MTGDSQPSPSSQGSEEWTSASPGPGSSMSPSQRLTSTAEQSSLPAGQASTSTTTFATSPPPTTRTSVRGFHATGHGWWKEAPYMGTLTASGGTKFGEDKIVVEEHSSEGLVSGVPISSRIYDAQTDMAPTLQAQNSPNRGGSTSPLVSISSVADSHVRTFPSQGSEPASQESDQDSGGSSTESSALFDLEQYSSKTWRVCSPQEMRREVTSKPSSKRWPTAGIHSAGGFWTANTSVCPRGDADCSCSPSLTTILQQDVSEKYSLSARAASGILRRATRRGRALPPALASALKAIVEKEESDS